MNKIARSITLRSTLSFTISASLMCLPSICLVTGDAAQEPTAARKARPKWNRPQGMLPDLDDIKFESNVKRESAAPIPSTIRSKKNKGKPWDGRRVGEPFAPGQLDQVAVNRRPLPRRLMQRAHAHSRFSPQPILYEYQFIDNFFSLALLRGATSEESLYWIYLLRAGHGQSGTSLKLAAMEFGRTLFESGSYAARTRDPHWFVYDLYKTYLMRDPDAAGWSMWENLVSSHGREYVRRGFEESAEFATLIGSLAPSGGPAAAPSSLISARVDPANQPRNGMLTRDASWSVPLLSLPGRNGLNLGLTLSYSSMVWTRSGPYFYFDEDNGSPSPGFRLGFPTVQRKAFDAQTGKNSYLLLTPSGHRVDLRQAGSSAVYEAADSSYLQLTESAGHLLLRSTDGTQLKFVETNNEYRCTQVKDSNGNFITVNYNSLGQINTVTDTLTRVITFNYDIYHNLLSITQAWSGQPQHQWVSFGWGSRNMQHGFASDRVIGTKNGEAVPVITQVTVNDTSHYTFEYSNSLQVSAIRNYFGTLERNATTFVYQAASGDVPRLTSSSASARNWSGYNNVPSQVTTQYSVDGDGACVLTAPDGVVYKTYYGTGWQKGLVTQTKVEVGGVPQKWTSTTWTQDNESVSYHVNPRVTETNVNDAGNQRRTTIHYSNSTYAQYGLPSEIREYAADASTVLRQRFTDYNLSQAYLDRRIIGLVSQVQVTNGSAPVSKTTYAYDDPVRLQTLSAAATQHDTAYSASFTTRGNLTSVSRWDVNDINNQTKKLTSFTNYFISGSLASATDPAGHINSISYADGFSDGVPRNTFAYPTTVTDADNFSSSVQYNFDFGAATRTQSPAPAGQSQGAIQTMAYNNLGQLERVTTLNNGAYQRFWYGAEFTASYATVNNVADELYSVQVTDGHGRVIGALRNHPGSNLGYSLVHSVYDLMGRTWLQSNPAEVNSSWSTSGGDDAAGLYYTQQSYDWQHRPLTTTHSDLTTRSVSYSGCGCAGGNVVTFTDEGTIDGGVAKRRQQRVYSDNFGRTVKTELLGWQNGSPYSTTVNTYNARDQITQVRQYAGTEGSTTFQDTTMNFDGYGRLESRHTPDQNTGTATTYAYYDDDTVRSITDARGASATHIYSGRHLLTGITYSAPTGVTTAPNATFGYDSVGNRTSMSDGLGTKSYSYDQLSRMLSETRVFTGVGTFVLAYGYNLANQVKKVTDASNSTINYGYDVSGRLSGVTGSDTLVAGVSTYASAFQYRAWGALKHISVGPLSTSFDYGSRTQPTNFNISGVVNENYDYYSDGRLKSVQNTTDSNFDRALSYDHIGRLTLATSGSAAQQGTTPAPFIETFAYNAFSDLTDRATESWGDSHYTDAGTFVNHRRVGWGYDASGRIATIDNRSYTYDSAGRNRSLTGQTWTGSTYITTLTESGHDGDGNRVRENSGTSGLMTLRYYLRSSVLGGAVLAELDSSGQKQTGYVYTPAGVSLATQSIGQNLVRFKQVSPHNTTERGISTSGSSSRVEFDPLGAKVRHFALQAPERGGDPGDLPGVGGPMNDRHSSLAYPGAGCTLDGIYMPCYMITSGLGKAVKDAPPDPFYFITARIRRQTAVWVPIDNSTGEWLPNELKIHPGSGGYYEFEDDPDAILDVFTQLVGAQQTPSPLNPLRNALVSFGKQLVDGNISEDCKNNVMLKLKSAFADFNESEFVQFVNSSKASIEDGTTSQERLRDAATPAAAVVFPGSVNVADAFAKNPNLNGLTSLTSPNLRIFVRPSRVNSSDDGINGDNKAFLWHEAIHGYGGSKGGTSYFDDQIQKAFGLPINADNTGNITSYIKKHCF